MDEEVARILEKFSDFLEVTNPISYMLRWIGWAIIKGLAWLVDSLSNITDSILGLKMFYDSVEITSFVEFLIPLSVILMGFSLLYTGYQLIFQKKLDREAIIVNVFMIMFFFALIQEGMEKANQFTDKAIDALDVVEEGSISQKVIKDNMTDLAQFDVTGWNTTELKHPNRIPKDRILKINITQSIDKDFELAGEKMTDTGREVYSHRLEYDDLGNAKKVKLDNGFFTAFKEKYYRWDWNFWTITITLSITAFTMLTISLKLAKLFYELTFNYVLAIIIAPADIHSGQKTKKILQSIINTFLVTIMIFLSMKIYLLGTEFITDKLDGVAYLIALFAFSLAVIDGPNIVERLFGIDAGLKSSWGAVAGGYAVAKGVTGATKGTANTLKGLSSEGKSAALKGVSGIAGVAGMAQGLRTKGQDQCTEQTSNGSDRGHSADIKAREQNQEKQSPNGSKSSGEIETGTQEGASSIEQEMTQQQQEKGQTGKGRVIGLHDQMVLNGVSSNGKLSAAAVNSPHSISSGSSNKMNIGDIQKNEKMSGDYDSVSPSSLSFSQSNYPSGSSEMEAEPNKETPIQEKGTDRETLHVGSLIANNVLNSQSVKTIKRTYQIGQNTGESLRNNIAKFRRKNQ
ncbi:pLS20_p028 family conjugation system transmembrane protein [Peribacillus sp. FSL E2-0159]|uniref:pLS20_p028 family conjugation system transmembrane protein n=1 Tax=Peribacillus sp. FSL E2-0159 TaxID=2975289 RepID=UPI00315AAFA6